MENMTLNEAMTYIVAQKGKSVLSDSKMLNAMLNDLAPQDAKTNHFVVQASASHYFDYISKCRDDQLEDAIEAAAENMKNDYADSVVDRITDSLYAAFSLTRPLKNASVNSANQSADPPVIIPAQQPYTYQQINAPGTSNNSGKIIVGIAVVLAVCLLAVNGISAGRHSVSTAGSNTETTAADTSTEASAAAEEAELDYEEEEEEPVTVEESTEAEYRMGTVYIAPDAEPPRIIVRTEPRKADDTATSKRKVNGDRVKVYETKQGSKYTWYRIGENEWIAGNGTSFFVKYD